MFLIQSKFRCIVRDFRRLIYSLFVVFSEKVDYTKSRVVPIRSRVLYRGQKFVTRGYPFFTRGHKLITNGQELKARGQILM